MKKLRTLKALIKPGSTKKDSVSIPSALDVLLATPIWIKDEEARVSMTISCRDSDYIPKIKNAGAITSRGGQQVQIMHNGLRVVVGGYHGEWMSRIIRELKGHHEPQEEKVFHEILKQLDDSAVMIELGAFWSYYSIWFNKTIKDGTNICCEPDPGNMEVGKNNARLNDANIEFIHAAAGSENSKIIEFDLESKPGQKLRVPIMSVDAIVAKNKLPKVDLLHMDVQGAELDALKGSIKTIRAQKLRFLIVSTHHYCFSKDPLTHQKCVDFIKENGGHIIASHTVLESFSGDGLIAASFSPRDAQMAISVSINHTNDSLFRPYETDLSVMIKAYDDLLTSDKNSKAIT